LEGKTAATTQEVSVAIAEAGGARSDAAVAFMPAYVRAAIAAAVLPAIRELDDERARSRAHFAERRGPPNARDDARVRGIVVPAADRERILAEKDPAKRERWLERAILATSIGEVLNDSDQAA